MIFCQITVTEYFKVTSGKIQTIDIEVSRLAIVCPGLFRITILCHSPGPKSG